MADASVTIEAVAPEALDELEPLWNALREHHPAAAPEFGPPRERAESWAVRRGHYSGWIADSGGFALVARDEERRAVGYAFVRLHGPQALWPSDASGELETLSVLPEARGVGVGVGSALIAGVWAALAEREIAELSIMVLHTNADGLRFYEREGFGRGAVHLWGMAPRTAEA